MSAKTESTISAQSEVRISIQSAEEKLWKVAAAVIHAFVSHGINTKPIVTEAIAQNHRLEVIGAVATTFEWVQ